MPDNEKVIETLGFRKALIEKVCSRIDFKNNQQCVHTPFDLCHEIIEKLVEHTNLKNSLICALNLEFVEVLCYDYGIEKKNIWFITDCQEKANVLKHDRYKGVNVATGNYLLTDLTKLTNGMKFDVIVGNPPYQETDENGNKKPSGHNLWPKFLEKSLSLLKDRGYIGYITPPFFSPAYKEIINNCFKENTTYFLNVGECGKHFTMGTLFSYYILQKKKPEKTDLVEYICQFGDAIYKGKTKFSNNVGFIPMLVCDNAFSILNKTIYSELSKLSFIEDFTIVNFVKEGKNKIRDGNNTKFTDDDHPIQNIKKLVVSKSGYLKPEYDNGTYGLTRNCFYVVVKSKKEAELIIKILNSKLYIFILHICKWNGFTSKRVLEKLPHPKNFGEDFTDEDVYKFFKLTKEEISFIEETIK